MSYERFVQVIQGEQYPSEYDMPSSEIQDLISRGPDVVDVYDLNLDTAGTLRIAKPGMGFVLWGYFRSSDAKYTEAYVAVALNSDGSDPSVVFPGKTGRGYRGSFSFLNLAWPADPNGAGRSAKFIVFKSFQHPWMGGLEAS